MSEKEKKGIRKHLKFVLDKLHEGIRAADYRSESKEEAIPHTTLDELLKLLEASGIAFLDKSSNIWYYTWKKEKEELISKYQELLSKYHSYGNIYEHGIKLDHSKSLIKAALHRYEIDNPFRSVKDIDIGMLKLTEGFKCFLQHLDTGYHDVEYILYKEWEEGEKDREEAEAAFHKELERIFSESGLELTKTKHYADMKENTKQVSLRIFGCIKDYLSLIVEDKLKERVKLELGDKGVLDPYGTLLAKNISIKNEIEEAIENCIHSEVVRNLYAKLIDIEGKTRNAFNEVTLKIGLIIIKIIEDKEPLRGECDRCPKITIGRQ